MHAYHQAPRAQREMTLLQSAVAACILDAMTDEEISGATGKKVKHISSVVRDLRVRYDARNRVALALALQREILGAPD